MLYAYLRMFGIPVAMLVWVVYRLLVKKRPWKEILPDLQLILFVCLVYY
jgi:hypothetical protein